MTCTDCSEPGPTGRRPPAALAIALALAVVGGMAVVAAAPDTVVRAGAAPVADAEDWHGNVRRSGWPND